ncbi:Dynamin [Penicillium verhagenii]|uniref:Dynamin n=1 Tax=Penicillium verhagenii TaxID=1562060 RepID=UPI0025458E18|nr:Dynamin [Penicillium verhagenii]KAJ5936764.1 Dynamin [Penicillium verhagenii]
MSESIDDDNAALKSTHVEKNVPLRSKKTSSRLNLIDRIRGYGISEYISLPQLVVCGDQSAGKSSVLEGITGIPFPRQDGLCTRFATEIILRHEPNETKFTATIIPHHSRDDETRDKLKSLNHRFKSFEELPSIIRKAGDLMGLSAEAGSGPTFASDVLRLELVGNTGVHLTIVDVPGLISVSENEDDVNLVASLVDSYLQNSRTIILAVVPASSDVDTQAIIQRARFFDKAGERTVGIITKPDLINKGTEPRVARLAKNCDKTKLALGFFLLKNPAPSDLAAGMTGEERRKVEVDFFSKEPWSKQGLDPSRIGIENLKSFLQELLDTHIETELVKVREEVHELLQQTNQVLVDLGSERKTANQIRTFLTRASTDYCNLVQSGVDGAYDLHYSSFFEAGNQDLYFRLRAAIYQKTRGQELPGTYNHGLVAKLFHDQSSRWPQIAKEHVRETSQLVSRFLGAVLQQTIKDHKVRAKVHQIVNKALEKNIKAGMLELEKLIEDEGRHPITYNRYYTDAIQKSRQDRSDELLKASVGNALESYKNTTGDPETKKMRLISTVQGQVVVDMKEQVCLDAETDLNAYYKIACRTFVDNVCRLVIERHILAKLNEAFNPTTVSSYADDELISLAQESPQVATERSGAMNLRDALERSLNDLKA